MYLGIDLHKRYAQVAVIDSEDQIVGEVRITGVNLDDLTRRYAGSRAIIRTANNYYHVYNTLAEYLDVAVAHPSRLTLIAHSDKKTDRVGIKELARLLRLNFAPQSYALTDEIRQVRAFIRGRQTLVEGRTKLTNKIHGLLTDGGITREVKLLSVEGRKSLQELSLLSPWDALLESYLNVIEVLIEQMTQLEAAIEERARSLPETQLLMTIPDVSCYSALLIYAEPGEVDRFDNHKKVVGCMGLAPTTRESGNSRIEGGISKRDSGWTWWILIQNAYSAMCTCKGEYLGRFFHRLNRRIIPKKAIVAAAWKLLVSVYYVLVREGIYNPPGVSA